MLRAAAEHGLAVVARGAGTKLAWGARPERPTWSSTLDRLTGCVEHAAGDLIVEVRAGAPLADVQAHVARPASGWRSTDPAGPARHGRRGDRHRRQRPAAALARRASATCSSASRWCAPTAWWPRPVARSSRTSPATTSASSWPARAARSAWSPRPCSGCTRVPPRAARGSCRLRPTPRRTPCVPAPWSTRRSCPRRSSSTGRRRRHDESRCCSSGTERGVDGAGGDARRTARRGSADVRRPAAGVVGRGCRGPAAAVGAAR